MIRPTQQYKNYSERTRLRCNLTVYLVAEKRNRDTTRYRDTPPFLNPAIRYGSGLVLVWEHRR